MKRINLLFEHIIDRQNIKEAFLKAVRGKRTKPEVMAFCGSRADIPSNLEELRRRLTTFPVTWGPYHQFSITDPKPRVISAAPIEDRVMHHAIMNILEPVFERPMIAHSYACRKSKGTHAAVLYVFSQ